jgi:hypothetical protein
VVKETKDSRNERSWKMKEEEKSAALCPELDAAEQEARSQTDQRLHLLQKNNSRGKKRSV